MCPITVRPVAHPCPPCRATPGTSVHSAERGSRMPRATSLNSETPRSLAVSLGGALGRRRSGRRRVTWASSMDDPSVSAQRALAGSWPNLTPIRVPRPARSCCRKKTTALPDGRPPRNEILVTIGPHWPGSEPSRHQRRVIRGKAETFPRYGHHPHVGGLVNETSIWDV